jgi:hypothetical protein
MPGDGGYSYRRAAELEAATRKAQEDAEKAAAGKTTTVAPRAVLTPEQRQANIARDLALSQTRGARPSGQDSQFYQPAYQPQYQNYANPLTAFNVSSYGTNPGMSQSMRAATAPGAGGVDPYYKHLQSFANLLSTQGDRNNINTLMDDMRQYGISAQDLQNAFSYNPTSSGGGSNTLTPELARSLMQRAMTTGLPNSESDKYGGYQAVKAMYDSYGGTRDEVGKQVSTRPLQFNPYTNSPSYSAGMPQMQTPFSYQQPQYQQQQMQTPFSYQPMQQMQQPMQQPAQTNYGPSQAIVGRSSQMRGTPNVMRRAKGGITSLLKKNK